MYVCVKRCNCLFKVAPLLYVIVKETVQKRLKEYYLTFILYAQLRGIDLDEWYSRLILHAVLTLFNKRISAD